MNSLLMTLGHNSSAIAIVDGKLVWGYETERFSRAKSDSRYPMFLNALVPKQFDDAYISHWSTNGQLSSMKEKYWQPADLSGVTIHTLNPDFTHHDAHIYGAMCYAGREYLKPGTIGVVVDGFGNYGEHLSIYDLSTGAPRLLRRYRGYDTSLGLWYQYATAFMGMKMHEDEYKLLGYEAHNSSTTMDLIQSMATQTARNWVDRMDVITYKSKFDPLYSVDALPAVRDHIFAHLNKICNLLEVINPASYEGRCKLAAYVQAVLENVVCYLVQQHEPSHLLLSGGVFYNVKLNGRLMNHVSGKICVYPLAGDQGAAIGVYYHAHPEFEFPDTLCWGQRALYMPGRVPNMHVVQERDALELCVQYINKYGYVNLVRDAMEFGPRALCNTSTLALPTTQVVADINAMNNRNTVMPMAPVMTRSMYHSLFRDTHKVHRCEEHMIMAMKYSYVADEMVIPGVQHFYKYPERYSTGRPQVVSNQDEFMHKLLSCFTCPLINTSFNFHGQPIPLDMPAIIDNHMMEYQRNPNIHTVVISNE